MNARARRLLAAAAVIALASAAGCGTSYYPPVSEPVLLANPGPPGAVRAAVMRALMGRRYELEREEPSRIIARRDKGSYSLRVAIEYDGAQYTVRYVDSAGYKTRAAAGGSVEVEASASKELKSLRSAVQLEMRRASQAEQREMNQQRQAQIRARGGAATADSPPPPQGPNVGDVFNAAAPVLIQNVPPPNTVQLKSSSYTCCINGHFYTCPRLCSQSGMNECREDPSRPCN